MGLIRRYSYLIAAVLCLVAFWFGVVRTPANGPGLAGFLGLAAVLTLVWVALRRGESPPNPARRLRKVLGSGRPVLVHFYSDFCMRCMAQKPRLDALARGFRGPVEFVFLNLSDPAVRELTREYQATSGTVILFDGDGKEVHRGIPAPALLEELVGGGRHSPQARGAG
ncbi:MAG: thioredoxin family protein [Firmicutes bacterium]|nr:thioredoxin family protein [Bacillota bacterium]